MGIEHARLASVLRDAGVEASEPDVRAAEIRVRPRIDAELAVAARREGREVVARVADLFFEELGRPGVDGATRAAFVAAWPSLWRRVPDDARPTLAVLAARGLRLGVVSNTGDGGARSRLAEAGLVDAFEFVLDSHLVGVEKPDPRIFAMAAARLAVPAGACVYVGDLYAVDVVGARAAGMHAVLLDPGDVWAHVDAPRAASLAELASRL
jgi:putative hydrolase of the HAD superfamily